MKTDLDLLPRADFPVIWNEFRTKVATLRETAENLTVTSIDQKGDMACARRVRLDLREIRIAVEHKRVELGESHLKEIQKVNGAAKAIREFIEPLEARLLLQETFAERVEADRVIELTKHRNDEVRAIWPGCPGDFGKMSETEYTALITRLRQESAEMAEHKRKQAEAEAALAAQQAETRRVEQAARAAIELAQRVALEVKQKSDAETERWRKEKEDTIAAAEAERREEQKRRDDEAEQVRFEQEQKHRAELSAASAIRTLERQAAEQRRQEDLRIEREKTAVLEAELKAERAVKLAEETRLRQLALAPDLEKLREFKDRLRFVTGPELENEAAKTVCWEAISLVHKAALLLDIFYKENLTPE